MSATSTPADGARSPATPFDYGTWSRLLAARGDPRGQGRLRGARRAPRPPRSLRRAPGLGEPGHRPAALPLRGPRARLLDQRLQCLRAARGDGGVPDPLGVESAGRPVLRAPAPRRGRPRGEPQRHRAPDPARAVRGAAHPLRDQLRVERLSADAHPGVRARRHPRDARLGHAPVPRERVELPRRRGRTSGSTSRGSSGCTPRTSRATSTRPRRTGRACSPSSPSTPGCRWPSSARTRWSTTCTTGG